MDEHAAYDGPRLLRKQPRCQAKKEDKLIDNLAILYNRIRTYHYLEYEDYDI